MLDFFKKDIVNPLLEGGEQKDETGKMNKEMGAKEKCKEAQVDVELSPNDPLTALIQAQGHYIFHLAAFIAICMVVNIDPQNTTYCFTHDATGKLVMSEDESSIFDQKVLNLKWTHLAIFIAQFAGTVNFTKELSINLSVTKKMLYFITVPLYWMVIIDAYETLRRANLNVEKGTSNADDVNIVDNMPMCI